MQFNSGISLSCCFSHTDFYLQSVLTSQGIHQITVWKCCETAVSSANSNGLSYQPHNPPSHPFCSCFRSNKGLSEMGFQTITHSKCTQSPVMYFTQASGSVCVWGEPQPQCSRGDCQGGDTGGKDDAACDAHTPAWVVPGWRCPSFHPVSKGRSLPRPSPSAGVQPAAGGSPAATHHSSTGQQGLRAAAAQNHTGVSKRAPMCSLITIPYRYLQHSSLGRLSCDCHGLSFPHFLLSPGSDPGWCTHGHLRRQECHRELTAGRSAPCHLHPAVCLQSTVTFCLLPSEMKLHDAGTITGKHFCHPRQHPQLYGLLNVN